MYHISILKHISCSIGYVYFWSVLNGGKFYTSFKAVSVITFLHLKSSQKPIRKIIVDSFFFQSRHQKQVTKLVVTKDDRLLFAADHVGYICVYDIKECGISQKQKAPKSIALFCLLWNAAILSHEVMLRIWFNSSTFIPAINFWRAHISSITG